MANASNTGFRPAYKLGGGNVPVMRFPITAAGNASKNVFVGDVMIKESTYGSVLPAGAAAGTTIVGVCVALYDSKGVPIGSPGSSTSTKYLASATAGYADVALALPDCIFIAQSQTSLATTEIFGTIANYYAAGDTTTAHSNHELATASAIDTDDECQILGIVNSPDNAWGLDVKVYIRFLASHWGQVNPANGAA